MQKELERLSQCHSISINIRGQNKRNELVYNIDCHCLTLTSGHMEEGIDPTTFILQEGRKKVWVCLLSVCNTCKGGDRVLFIVQNQSES